MKFGDITLRQAKKLCEKYKECLNCPIHAHCEQIFGSKVPHNFKEDRLEAEIELPKEVESK